MVLRCDEVMPGCAAEVRAETEDDVMRQAAEHAKNVHGLPNDRETVMKLKAAIRSE